MGYRFPCEAVALRPAVAFIQSASALKRRFTVDNRAPLSGSP
jgi:hypothetical protein